MFNLLLHLSLGVKRERQAISMVCLLVFGSSVACLMRSCVLYIDLLYDISSNQNINCIFWWEYC